MGVRKFRSVEQMPGRPSRSPLDPENLRLALGLTSLAGGLNPVPLVPGVAKYRSRDQAVATHGSSLPPREGPSLNGSYRRLEQLVEAVIPEGVTYRVRLGPDEVEDGWFSPAPFGYPPPQIGIYRPRHQDEPGDTLHELLTLAHELGHYRSFEKGFRGADYEEAIQSPWRAWPTLSVGARHAILQEERRAWQFAREILAQVGFSDWEAFWVKHQNAIGAYRCKLEGA